MGQYAVVVGSLNIDLVVTGERPPRRGETTLGTGCGVFPGGKGANQAVQLARLGMETYMVGRVGADIFAAQVIESLEAAGVKTGYLIRDAEGDTGKGFVFTDAAGDNWIVVVPGANMRWKDAEIQAAADVIRGAQVVVVQLEIPLEIVAQVIDIASESRVFVVLNPAPARALPGTLLRKVDLLVPNETEASQLVGIPVTGTDSAASVARLLQASGVSCVTVTLGSGGSITASGDEILHVPAFQVEAVDATAAGDSFCSSLAYALTRKDDLKTALRFASASGALTVKRLGAQPSLPTLDQINRFLSQQE